jgi:hypothetical protein
MSEIRALGGIRTMPDWKAEIRRRLTRLQLEPMREAAIVEELAQDSADLPRVPLKSLIFD